MGNGLERFDWFAAHVLAGTLDEETVRAGFAPRFLEAVPVAQILAFARGLQSLFVQDEVSRVDAGDRFVVTYGTMAATGAVEADAPHRFIGLRVAPPEQPIDDDRLVDAPFVGEGDAPLAALRAVYADMGLIGVVAAGFTDDGAQLAWRAAGGYSDLATGAACTPDTRMLAGSICKLLTATTALSLVAEGRLDLDAPANEYLQSLRVASDAVTTRHLLTHTSGVSSAFNHFVEEVGPPEEILGAVVAVDFAPGTQHVYSNGGYTVLGEVIAGITGMSVVEAITQRVIEPLGMRESSYAMRWPDDVGPGYELRDGKATPLPRTVPSVAAAGGLVTTTSDLGRFVAGWRNLLPADLADQAVSPQFSRPDGGNQGFGWIVGDEYRGHAGGTLTYTSSLLWRIRDGAVAVVMTNRTVAAQDVNLRLLNPGAGA